MTTSAPSILDTLNEKQLAAATSKAERLLVVAPPGSGKTRVLAARIVFLLRERQMPSHQVLALVFTRAAAAELRGRVVAEVGEQMAELLCVCTFHSLALRLLRTDGFDLRVASEDEEREVFDSLFRGPEKRPEARKVGKRRLREWLTHWAATARHSKSIEETFRLAALHRQRLAGKGLVAFDDLVPRALGALATGGRAFRKMRDFRHVLVDEAHDMTPAELHLVEAAGHESTLVADGRQSIYSWRGADYGAVLRAYDPDFHIDPAKDFERIDLTQTYRFGPAIATKANEISEGWGFLPVVPAEGAQDFYTTLPRDKLLGAVTICAGVHGPEGVAVLCRTNHECETVAAEIGDLARVVRREEPRDVQVAVAMARLVLDQGDDAAFRVLWKHAGGGASELRAIEAEAGHARSLFVEALSQSYSPVPERIEAVHDFTELSGFDQLFELGECIPEHLADLVGVPLQDALDSLADRQDADAFAAVGDHVAVATIHSAKGREWPAVVVLDFPKRSREDDRCLYVACTRAKRELVFIEQEYPYAR